LRSALVITFGLRRVLLYGYLHLPADGIVTNRWLLASSSPGFCRSFASLPLLNLRSPHPYRGNSFKLRQKLPGAERARRAPELSQGRRAERTSDASNFLEESKMPGSQGSLAWFG